MTSPATAPTGGAASQVAAVLRDRIISGGLLPGGPVRDSAVALELGVSRNTAREGLALLRHEGLLAHRSNQGFVVPTLTHADVRDIYAARTALEVRAVQDSARAPDTALEQVRDALASTEEAQRREGWTAYARAGLEFHAALVRLLGSPMLDAFFATVLGRLRLAFAAAPDLAEFQRPWAARDRQIWERLRAGDRAAAEDLLRLYLHDSELMVLDAVRRSRTSATPDRRNRP